MKEDTSLQFEINSLAEELSARYEELNLLYRVGNKLNIAESLEDTARDIIKDASNILHSNAIVLSVPEKKIFECISDDPDYPKDKLKHIVNKIRESCNSKKGPHAVNSRSEFKKSGFKDRYWFKFAATSIKVKDENKGLLTVLTGSDKKDYSTGDLKLLSVLAGQLSIVITNSELYQDLKDFLLNLVRSMVSAIEAKDSYTRGHSERVNEISVMIARAMGFSEKEIENISWAAILHDIGKIGIPENVLTKPGRLTDEEYALIMAHPRKGYEILKPIVQLKEALQGILYHQERYDGKGYPKGLKGKEIPVYARIIALADTYDAITSSRAYRQRNTHLNAMEEIKRVAGVQLDPEVVKAFITVCNTEPGFIKRGHQ